MLLYDYIINTFAYLAKTNHGELHVLDVNKDLNDCEIFTCDNLEQLLIYAKEESTIHIDDTSSIGIVGSHISFWVHHEDTKQKQEIEKVPF